MCEEGVLGLELPLVATSSEVALWISDVAPPGVEPVRSVGPLVSWVEKRTLLLWLESSRLLVVDARMPLSGLEASEADDGIGVGVPGSIGGMMALTCIS